MKIFIRVKTKARKEGVEKLDGDEYLVLVKEAPEKGKANKRLIELLADYFNISKSAVEITSGETSKRKIVEIAGINNDSKDGL
jgi:hypothetical protein